MHGGEALDRVQYLNVHDYRVPKEHMAKSLDPNHTHHILVGGVGGVGGGGGAGEGGSVVPGVGWGGEIATRNLIEEALCRATPDEDDEADRHDSGMTTSPMALLRGAHCAWHAVPDCTLIVA